MGSGWQTFGHESVKRVLDKQLKLKKFPHAYLFFGPEGVGKKTLALEFAAKILGAGNLSVHPDFQILEEADNIAVERTREFIASLGFKPLAAKYRVAVVNDAQNLSSQSGNALLKTL